MTTMTQTEVPARGRFIGFLAIATGLAAFALLASHPGDAAKTFSDVLHNEAAVARCDIEIRCGTEAAATHSVAAKSYQRAAVDVPVAHRGVVIYSQFELRTRYPFGWFRAWTYVQSPLSAIVAPDPRGNPTLPPASAADGAATQTDRRGDEDFAGLRVYEPGVPLKHMAWKVLARGGEPAVRSYTGLGARPEWLDWAALAHLDVEARLSQLCLWILENEAASNLYGLRIPGTTIEPGGGTQHRSVCLRTLARYAGAERPGGTHP